MNAKKVTAHLAAVCVISLLGLFAGTAADAQTTVAEAFSPSTVGVGDTATLTISIANAGSAATGVGFTDTYPSNLINATPSNVTTTCGGTLTGGQSGGSSVGLSGGAIAAASSCTVIINVTGSIKGNYVNSTGSVSSSGGTGTAASATLTVVAKPAVVASFSGATIPVNGTATLSLLIANSNTVALSGVSVTDSLPSGLVIANTPALSNSCGGLTSGGLAASGNVGFTGGNIAAASNCTLSVAVTSSTAAAYTDTAGGVGSAQYSGTGAAGNSALLTVLAPPTIAKSFSPNPNTTGTSTALIITLSNPNSTGLTGVSFSDTYPAGFGNLLLPGLSNTCNGTATGASLGASVGLTAGTIAPNGSCTVSINVAGATAGTYTNVTGTVSSTNGGTGTSASAPLTLVSNTLLFNSSIAKSFSPTRVAVGASATMTLTVSNTSLVNATAVAFSDTFPAGLVVAATPALTNTCNGTITGATANSTSLSLSGGRVNAGASCTITVAVQSPTVGNYANTTGTLSSSLGTAGTSNTATLQVVAPATIVKSFSPSTILLGNTSTLSLVISNPNAIALSGVSFSDSFPANLSVSSTPTVTNSCGGTLSGTAAGSNSLSLSGGSIAAGAGTTCTITIQVISAVLGSNSNTTGGVSANETSTGSASNTAVLIVAAPDLRVSKSHSGSFTVGTNGTYTVTVDNVNGGFATSGTITVTDTLPSGLTYVATGSGGTGWSCASSGQVVTCTSTTAIAAGGTGTAITLNVAVAATAVPSVVNNAVVAGGNEPTINSNNNIAADYTIVNAAAQSTLSTDGRQTSTPGTSVFYSHIFTAGFAGSVTFVSSDASSPAIAGWASSIYQDTNCNGLLDGSEGTSVLSGGIAVAAGAQICVVDKVFIPAVAAYNAQDQTSITATFTPSSAGTAATLTRIDLTTVGSAGGAGLALNKTVRNVTTGETASANDSASSGQVLEYTIAYANNGAASLSTIVISDTTPYFTRFVSAQCTTPLPANFSGCSVTTQPAVSSQGSLAWTFAGTLQSNATGSVSFRVAVQ